jgi:hypothetical protein
VRVIAYPSRSRPYILAGILTAFVAACRVNFWKGLGFSKQSLRNRDFGNSDKALAAEVGQPGRLAAVISIAQA